jgi:hypothetical protein
VADCNPRFPLASISCVRNCIMNKEEVMELIDFAKDADVPVLQAGSGGG